MADREISASQLANQLGRWQERPLPAYQALGGAIELLVLDGRLPVGVRLPAERDLARVVGTSRTTVTAAYAGLRERGFVTSRRGSGSRTTLPPTSANHSNSLMPTSQDGRIDLACAASTPAPSGLAPAVTAATQTLPAFLTGHGYEPHGVPALREILAARYTARGLATDPDQIIVTGGGQQALALALRAFAEPGDRVLVELPTYPNALEAIRRSHARPVPAPLDPSQPDGWDVQAFATTIRQTAPRLAYLIPDFQNPVGALMDIDTRTRLAATLADARVLTLVDEVLTDLSLDLEPDAMPAPFGAGRSDHQVVVLGSASKAIWGGLRVGWLRAPSPLVPALLAARASLDLGTPILSQLIAAELLSAPNALLTEQRRSLRSRRDALMDAVRSHLPQWRFATPPGGLSLWCELPRPVSTVLATLVGQRGVRVVPGSMFGPDGTTLERFQRLPFTLPEADLVEAVRRIAEAYASIDDHSADDVASTGGLANVVA